MGEIPTGNDYDLSRAEIRRLEQIANGVTQTDVATSEGLSVGAIEKSLRLARKKLGAKNLFHAVGIATRDEIITILDNET